MEVDVTGLMIQPVEGWQARVAELCRPDEFYAEVFVWQPEKWTVEELTRLKPKLAIVKRYAQYMAAGMAKGTIKYTSDEWSVEQWMSHLIGEGADQSNYAALLYEAWRREQEGRNDLA